MFSMGYSGRIYYVRFSLWNYGVFDGSFYPFCSLEDKAAREKSNGCFVEHILFGFYSGCPDTGEYARDCFFRNYASPGFIFLSGFFPFVYFFGFGVSLFLFGYRGRQSVIDYRLEYYKSLS